MLYASCLFGFGFGIKEKLTLAAKARIRRMVAPKRRRTDLAVPAWVSKEWNKGTEARDRMADVLQNANWNKDLSILGFKVISKQNLSLDDFICLEVLGFVDAYRSPFWWSLRK